MARSRHTRKTMAGAPQNEAAPAWLHSCPPKRLFGLVNDVAAGNADIVQVAVGPLRQFAGAAACRSRQTWMVSSTWAQNPEP